MTRTRLAVLFLALLLTFTFTSPLPLDTQINAAASHHYPWAEPGIIQPGAKLDIGGTLGFLFLSLSDTYPDGEPVIFASKAGHGSGTDVGEVLSLWNGPEVGVVVAQQYAAGNDDWALIRVFDESRQYVEFSIRYWTGPTGMPVPGEIELDDVVCQYGYGQGFDTHETTRPRCYRLTSARYQSPSEIGKVGYFPKILAPGDSGSPIFHYETGQALGINLGIKLGTQEGHAIDVCSLIQRFADHGYDVELATAPYDPPMERPTAPAPHAQPFVPHILNTAMGGDDWGEWETECVAG